MGLGTPDTLELGTPGRLLLWALQGDSGAGDCGDILGLGTPALGHSKKTMGLGTPGTL